MLMQAMRADQPRPARAAPSGSSPMPEPHDAVGAELHQHAGVEHRDRGRRRGVAVGRPGVQRPDAGQDAEADVEGEEHPRLQPRVELRRLQLEEREATPMPAADVEREDADQDERRPEAAGRASASSPRTPWCRRRSRGTPSRRCPAGRTSPARAPDADQQVHRQHGDLVEQEEDEEVERDEDAVDAGDQQQQQRVELLAARPSPSTRRTTPAKMMIDVSSTISRLMPSTPSS